MSEIPDACAGHPRRWLALPVLLMGAFLPILDFNIVNLALPAIRHDLRASSSDAQFVISAYAAAYAVFLITGGRLGDRFGRRRIFILGVTGFTLASVLCGLAPSPGLLILGRVLQGLTATLMTPQVLASIRVLFPAGEQGRALALYGATFGLANICGQILGGLLVSGHPFGWTWQAIFWVNVPLGVLALAGSVFFLADSRAEHRQAFDFAGVVWLSLTLVCLVFPLIEGRETGWPLWILGMLALSPVCLAVFVRHEAAVTKRGGGALVEFVLFRQGGFVVGMMMAFAFYMLASFYLTFSEYLQNGLHMGAWEAGLATLPFAGGFFITSLASAPIMQRLGPKALTLGFTLLAIGLGLLCLVVTGAVALPRAPALVCAGIGFGIVMPSVIKAVIGNVDARHAGLASGIVVSTLQVSASVGVAVIGGVFYGTLKESGDYGHAFGAALACCVGAMVVGGLLSFCLPSPVDKGV